MSFWHFPLRISLFLSAFNTQDIDSFELELDKGSRKNLVRKKKYLEHAETLYTPRTIQL